MAGPSIEGLDVSDGEWRLDVDRYRDFLEVATGLSPGEGLSGSVCYRIRNRLNAIVEERKRQDEWDQRFVEEYPDIGSGGRAYGLNERRRTRVALAMVTRGEFSLVVAALAVTAPDPLPAVVSAVAVGYILAVSVLGTVLMRYSAPFERFVAGRGL